MDLAKSVRLEVYARGHNCPESNSFECGCALEAQIKMNVYLEAVQKSPEICHSVLLVLPL